MMDCFSMEKQIRVQECFCDMFYNMPLSYMLKEAQQISGEHCETLGIGNDYMKGIGKAFLLAKLKVDIARQPKGGEEITIKTVPYLPRMFAYPRFTYFMDQQGNTLVTVSYTHLFRHGLRGQGLRMHSNAVFVLGWR